MTPNHPDRPHKEPGPDHPITIEPVDRRVDIRVPARGARTVIAATIEPLLLRENGYDPVPYIDRAHVDMAALTSSKKTSWCPYKGEATYYHIETADGLIEDAAWTYERPFGAVGPIEKAIAFYASKTELSERAAEPMEGEAGRVLTFWLEETPPEKRFKRDDAFDYEIDEKFRALYAQAARGDHDDWSDSPGGALALLILLDQFSRNLNRGSGAAFAHDAKALSIARAAVAAGHDLTVTGDSRAFFYMPYMHAEDMAAQDESVHLFRTRLPGSDYVSYAQKHRDIIEKFGRYPHRNPLLGRKMTEAEQTYLDEGGATF